MPPEVLFGENPTRLFVEIEELHKITHSSLKIMTHPNFNNSSKEYTQNLKQVRAAV